MDIKIYQNYYAPELKKYLDPALIPHDNTSNENPEYREYWLFLKMYESGKHKEADYTGLVSWKFNEKTNIKGTEFIEFIREKPGYDVYFINPLPFLVNAYAFQNVWYQGDFYHPGLLHFMQRILDKLNYGIDLKSFRNDESTTLFCNYWVGNERFWDRYIHFTKPIYECLRAKIDPDERKFVSRIADKVIGANYIPFIFERLFSTLLVTQDYIKYLNYRYSDSDLNGIPSEDRTAIVALRKTAYSSGTEEKSAITDSVRLPIQEVLRKRQQMLEASKETSVGMFGGMEFADRYRGMKRRFKTILSKYRWTR
jgi:hypothetical protein